LFDNSPYKNPHVLNIITQQQKDYNLAHSSTSFIMSETRYTTRDATKFTLYDVLQVSPKASLEEIKSSFHKLARHHHPDKLISTTTANIIDDTSATVNLHFPDIQRAWELLRDADQRKVYDQELLQQRLHYDSRQHGAITLEIKDLESAIDEETQETFFVYDCRCGEEIQIDHEMMQYSSSKNRTDINNNPNAYLMMDCPGCCFVYKVNWT
jgi:curved DNA-binding protein CbpA